MLRDIIFNTTTAIPITDANLQKGPDKRRVLLVDAEVSASGKVINGRIYPPSGHRNGIKSWYTPRGKAVIKYHDEEKDPIGRIVSAEWQDSEHLALGFLGNNTAALADIKRAYAGNNPKQIYKAMSTYNAFDQNWPGLGRVVGKLKISDQDAIEKFMDERFMYFSAGQGTDGFWCMTCGVAWHKGEQCEHAFGTSDEDGNPVIYLCGNMKGRELSVVNNPANDTSFVLGMQLEDNSTNTPTIVINDLSNYSNSSIANIILEKNMDLKDLQTLDVKTLIDLLNKEDSKLTEFKDAISGDTQYEIGWLIKIHDALHSMYDYVLRYESDTATIPGGVYKLHGLLHDMSIMKSFRDSFVNGQLDKFSVSGEESEEYVYKYESDDSAGVQVDVKAIIDEALSTATGKIIEEIKNGQKEDKDEGEEEVLTDEPVDDETIDWEVLDMALESLLSSDAKLSTEKRESLPASSFCGPNRSFPVPDCAHATAARRLINRAKLSSDQKAKVLACVNRKAKNMSCDSSENCKCGKTCEKCAQSDSKLTALTADYTNALSRIDYLQTTLTDTIKSVTNVAGIKDDISDKKLDELITWFNNIEFEGVKEDSEVKTLRLIDGASVALPKVSDNAHKAEEGVARVRLSPFESKVVSTYANILAETGQDAANKYLKHQKPYLAKDFDINKYMKSEKE